MSRLRDLHDERTELMMSQSSRANSAAFDAGSGRQDRDYRRSADTTMDDDIDFMGNDRDHTDMFGNDDDAATGNGMWDRPRQRPTQYGPSGTGIPMGPRHARPADPQMMAANGASANLSASAFAPMPMVPPGVKPPRPAKPKKQKKPKDPKDPTDPTDTDASAPPTRKRRAPMSRISAEEAPPITFGGRLELANQAAMPSSSSSSVPIPRPVVMPVARNEMFEDEAQEDDEQDEDELSAAQDLMSLSHAPGAERPANRWAADAGAPDRPVIDANGSQYIPVPSLERLKLDRMYPPRPPGPTAAERAAVARLLDDPLGRGQGRKRPNEDGDEGEDGARKRRDGIDNSDGSESYDGDESESVAAAPAPPASDCDCFGCMYASGDVVPIVCARAFEDISTLVRSADAGACRVQVSQEIYYAYENMVRKPGNATRRPTDPEFPEWPVRAIYEHYFTPLHGRGDARSSVSWRTRALENAAYTMSECGLFIKDQNTGARMVNGPVMELFLKVNNALNVNYKIDVQKLGGVGSAFAPPVQTASQMLYGPDRVVGKVRSVVFQ